MITTKTRCRSKNPSACPFHGSPEKSLNALVNNKDIKGYINYREKLDEDVKSAQSKVDNQKRHVDQMVDQLDKAQLIADRDKDEINGAKEALGQKSVKASYEDYIAHQRHLVPDFSRMPENLLRDNFKNLKDIVLWGDETIKSNRLSIVQKVRELRRLEDDLAVLKHEAREKENRRDSALGKSNLSATKGYAALQTHMSTKGQKAFENYNNEINSILGSKNSLATQEIKITKLKSNLIAHMEEASIRLGNNEAPRNSEMISGVEFNSTNDPSFGAIFSMFKEEENQAFYLLDNFKKASINTIFTA